MYVHTYILCLLTHLSSGMIADVKTPYPQRATAQSFRRWHAAHRWPGVGRTWPFHQILPSSRIGWKWKGGCSIGSLGPTHCCAEWMTVRRCANVLTGLAKHLGLRSVLSPMGR